MITFTGSKNEVVELLGRLGCDLRPAGVPHWQWAIFDLNALMFVGYYNELSGSGELRIGGNHG